MKAWNERIFSAMEDKSGTMNSSCVSAANITYTSISAQNIYDNQCKHAMKLSGRF